MKPESAKVTRYHILLQLMHGTVLTFAFHPFDVFIAILISFSGFLWCLEKHCIAVLHSKHDPAFPFLKTTNIRKRYFFIGFSHSLVFFIGHFTTSLYWLVNPLLLDIKKYFFIIPLCAVVVPILISLFYAIAGGIVCVFVIMKPLSQNIKFKDIRCKIALSYAFAFWIAEFLRSHLILPFPWNLLGYASSYSIGMMQICSVIGVYGLGLLIYIIGVIPYIRDFKYISAVTFITFLIVIWGNDRLKDSEEHLQHIVPKVFLHLVQPNITNHYNITYDKRVAILEKTISITESINTKLLPTVNTRTSRSTNKSLTHLILFPEGGIPFIINKQENELLREFMQSFNSNTFLITGIDRFSKEDHKYYNSIVAINNMGEIIDSYDKNILVPFGEYIPMHKFFNLFNGSIVGDVEFFSPGIHKRNLRIYHKDDEMSKQNSNFLMLVPTICYESIFSPLTHHRNIHGVNAIINVTNDNWLGNSIGPYQHLAMSRMRAIEQGIPVVRAANSGISAVIDSYGRVIKKLDLNEEGTINVYLPENTVDTLYMKFIEMFH